MKLRLLFLLLAVLQLKAQQKELLPARGFFSAVIVKNMEDSQQWYTTVLGFEVLNQHENEARGLKQANLRSGEIQLELIELSGSVNPAEILPEKQKGSRFQGFFKFGMVVEDFDQWTAHLKAMDINITGQVVKDPLSGKRMLIIKDPDGNRVQLFEK